MPSLITKYREKETAVKLKKVYSILSQSYITASDRYENPLYWVWAPQGKEVNQTLSDYLIENIQIIKICDTNECIPNVMYKRLNGVEHANYYNQGSLVRSFILNDGTLIIFWGSGECSEEHTTCANILVDLNGSKQPNQYGRDFWGFMLTPTTILPFGVEDHPYAFSTSCNRNQDSYLNGIGCTAWVIYNENMDYLHCDDLNWGTKTKCK